MELPINEIPRCIKEGAAFMSPTKATTHQEHPYAFIWKNLQPAEMELPSYSLPVVPFEQSTLARGAGVPEETDAL